MTESTDVQEPKTEAGAEPEAEHLSEYTTQTGDASATAPARTPARKPVVTGNAMGTGRRKEAIARVRISAGTGKWLINDRSLDEYFPNKVHQQLISEPFVTLGADDAFDVVARITGGGVTGQAGALRLGIARALDRGPGEPPEPEAGRLPDQGRQGEGTEEGRAEEGPEGSAVLEALISASAVPRKTRSGFPWVVCSVPTVSGGSQAVISRPGSPWTSPSQVPRFSLARRLLRRAVPGRGRPGPADVG